MGTRSAILFVFITVFANLSNSLEIKPESIKNSGQNQELCKKFAKNPYFETDIIIGKPWRMYYSWNVKLDTVCLDMVFKNATPAMIRRISSDMSEYLAEQPYWDSAILHLSMGRESHEILLFPDQGAAGSLIGVPNLVNEGDISPARRGVQLLKFFVKLIKNGKYLIMVDCHMGGVSLSTRPDQRPYRSEIAAAVAEVDLGDGFPACTKERNKEEQFFVR